MSDMNSLGTVLADMGDNLAKLHENLNKSIDRLNVEREVMIKNINDHYSVLGQIIVDHIREVEKLQGVNHVDITPDPNHRRYGDTL